MKNTSITIDVTLDENQVPDQLSWSAPDGGIDHQETHAMFLSTWDKESQESARIDLWTKRCLLTKCVCLFTKHLLGCNSYMKATQDVEMGEAFQQFCDYFSSEHKLGKVQKTKDSN